MATTNAVFIQLENYVSAVSLNTTFEISSPIVNPTFSITPTSDARIASSPAYTYQFTYNANTISFTISMQSGSNVNIQIFTGEEVASTSAPSINIDTTGDWNNGINNVNYNTITYTYINPGDFDIKVNISNYMNYFTFVQHITIISKVDDLVPGLMNSPVIFSFNDGNYGTAQFTFAYIGTSKAGSHSTVTFWPGDTQNATYGPFTLGMDFNANTNKVPLVYYYQYNGTFTCTFLVANLLGSKSFSLIVPVVVGIDGFYIDVVPKYVKPGTLVTVGAYLIQGYNVHFSFAYTINGVTTVFNSLARTCKILCV